jgi:hypothetical protein
LNIQPIAPARHCFQGLSVDFQVLAKRMYLNGDIVLFNMRIRPHGVNELPFGHQLVWRAEQQLQYTKSLATQWHSPAIHERFPTVDAYASFTYMNHGRPCERVLTMGHCGDLKRAEGA